MPDQREMRQNTTTGFHVQLREWLTRWVTTWAVGCSQRAWVAREPKGWGMPWGRGPPPEGHNAPNNACTSRWERRLCWKERSLTRISNHDWRVKYFITLISGHENDMVESTMLLIRPTRPLANETTGEANEATDEANDVTENMIGQRGR